MIMRVVPNPPEATRHSQDATKNSLNYFPSDDELSTDANRLAEWDRVVDECHSGDEESALIFEARESDIHSLPFQRRRLLAIRRRQKDGPPFEHFTVSEKIQALVDGLSSEQYHEKLLKEQKLPTALPLPPEGETAEELLRNEMGYLRETTERIVEDGKVQSEHNREQLDALRQSVDDLEVAANKLHIAVEKFLGKRVL